MNNAYNLPSIENLESVISEGPDCFYIDYTYGGITKEEARLIYIILTGINATLRHDRLTFFVGGKDIIDPRCLIMSTESIIKRFKEQYPQVTIKITEVKDSYYNFEIEPKS